MTRPGTWRKCLTLKVQSGTPRLRAAAAMSASIRPKPDERCRRRKLATAFKDSASVGQTRGQRAGESINGQRLLLVLCALVEFHEDMAEQGEAAGRGGSVPGAGGRVSTLDVYHHIGIQKTYSLEFHSRGRFSAPSRIALTYSVLSAYFLPGPMSLYCSAQTSKHPCSSQSASISAPLIVPGMPSLTNGY